MRVVPRFVLLGLVLLLGVEVAVLVPVIVTQRQKDEGLAQDQLQGLTNDFASRVNTTISLFMYNVVRAAAAAPAGGFLSQQALEANIQLEDDPRLTPTKLYIWTPFVSAAERGAYELFYGFNITDLKNGTSADVVRAGGRPLYIPYTIFVPRLPANSPTVSGFDLLPYNVTTTSVLFKNATKFLSIPSMLIAGSRTNNNFGFVAAAQNKNGRGYMFGRIGSKDLLEFSLGIPRASVTLAAFVLSSNGTRQALFFDDVPELTNATTLAIFSSLPTRSMYYTANFSSFGERIMVAVRYSDRYASQFAGNTWVILVAVLAPVCFLIDVIFVIVSILWHRRKKLHKMEERKRKDAQVMISYVNHEIRNPLQTILGLADFELEEAEEQGNVRLADNLGAIVRAAEFIEHIASDVLDLRRVEEGKVEIEYSDVNVRTLVSGLEKTVKSLASRKPDVVFLVDVDAGVGTIRTDRYRLEQVLLNFLTNAFKHTDAGQVRLSVSFSKINVVRFAVWDTGKGIPPEKKATLFQQFAQVTREDSAELRGFGLGLYLTKMLAELLGGHVGFESTFGLGSVFWVDLPVELGDESSIAFQFQDTGTALHRPLGLVQ